VPSIAKREVAGAVILGGAHGSLAVARSLGRRGIPVWFVTHDHPIAKYSRYVVRSFDWTGPSHENAARWLVEFAAKHKLDRWVLFAGGDEEVRLIACHHAMLEQAYRLTTPLWKIARIACDKRLTYEHAQAIGLDTPWSRYPNSRDEVAALDCRFPLILKPRVHAGRNAFTDAKAWRVDDRAALLARYVEAAALVGPDAIAIQELIPGDGKSQFSYAGVWSDGRAVASLVGRRTRQYPIDFGASSTFVETIEHDEIEAAASRFLASLHFSGLVEVEFKYDSRDRRYKLLDVNPRPWTWIALGSAAGIDLPWLQWRLAHGEAVAPSRGRVGARWTHALRDLVSAVQLTRRGRLSLRGYWASRPSRSTVFAAFAIDDPLPGILDLPVLIPRLARRRWQSSAGFRWREMRRKFEAPRRPLLKARIEYDHLR
jgi:predicted ATP-grasp superfamily ATP-dependent carboligase